MADRGRQYRLHQEALAKIQGRSRAKNVPRAKSSICGQPLRPYSLKGKAQKEEQMRIDYENQKMKNALLQCNPTLTRKELEVLDRDHKHQVKRMTGFRREVYGFPTQEKLTNTKRPMRKPSELNKTEIVAEAETATKPVTETETATKPVTETETTTKTVTETTTEAETEEKLPQILDDVIQ